MVAAGIAAQLSAAPSPPRVERHFDLGDLPDAMASSRLEAVLRGGHPCEVVDSVIKASFMKALLDSPAGMLRGFWRSSMKWFGLVGRSLAVVLLPGKIPVHAEWSQASDLDESPSRAPQDLDDREKFRGPLDPSQ